MFWKRSSEWSVKSRSSFDEVYSRSIHETIREELDEGGGNRQIAVKSFYVSRHLEILAQTLKINPKHIARVAAEWGLLPDGLLRDVAESLISYCLGSVLGRWDVRLATGERQLARLARPVRPAASLLAGDAPGTGWSSA